jgi:hypothetical protein
MDIGLFAINSVNQSGFFAYLCSKIQLKLLQMQEKEYTFVTIDDTDSLLSDAIVVDMDSDDGLSGIVVVDDDIDSPDFITLSDDTIMLSDADMIDEYSSDISDIDISIMI